MIGVCRSAWRMTGKKDLREEGLSAGSKFGVEKGRPERGEWGERDGMGLRR